MTPSAPLPDPISFKEKLLGRHSANSQEELDLDLWVSEHEDDQGIEEDNDEPDCPSIRLSKEEKIRLRKPWQNTLIIKLIGRSIGFILLLRKIKEIWKPKASIDLVALDNGFFLAKFASMDDYEYAMLGGPWMIFNHYLTVRQWQHNFDPNQSSLQRLLVWVRIPCLQIEYFHHQFLMRVGSKIGRPIRVDDATSTVSRGHYARICVEIDLLKPLVAKFKLRRRVRRLEYEGLHLVCFGCGMYGHRKDSCPLDKSDEMPAVPEPTTGEQVSRKQERTEADRKNRR